MSLYGYKPKTRRAPWTTVPGASIRGRTTSKNTPEARPGAVVRRFHTPGRVNTAEKARKALYREDARAFVRHCRNAGFTCQVVAAVPELLHGRMYGHPISARLNEVHHIFGRRGLLLNWRPGWMPASKQGHRWCHMNISEARRLCFYAPLGFWENAGRVLEVFGDCKGWLEVQAKIRELRLNEPTPRLDIQSGVNREQFIIRLVSAGWKEWEAVKEWEDVEACEEGEP